MATKKAPDWFRSRFSKKTKIKVIEHTAPQEKPKAIPGKVVLMVPKGQFSA